MNNCSNVMMQRTSILATLLAVLIPALHLYAQQPGTASMDEFYTYGDTYYLDVVTLPGNTPQRTRVQVDFRLSYDLLTFHRASYAYRKGSLYEAPAMMYVEAVGTDGVIGDRAIWQDTVRVEDYSLTNSKRHFLPGAVELSLRPGVYTIKYIVSEGKPGSGFSESLGPIKVDDFNSPSPAIGMPLFLRRINGDTLDAATIDGNALFGHPILAYVPLGSAEVARSLRYEIWTVAKPKGPTPRMLSLGTGRVLDGVRLGPAIPVDGNFRFMLRSGADSAGTINRRGAFLEISSDDLSPDDYLLLLNYEAGNNSVTDSVLFSLKWEDMPLSLTRPDYAIRALYPIAGDDTIQSLLDISKDDSKRQALEMFWKEKDPTPGTHFNEAMAEYYRRVDYAFFNFKNLGQGDGVYTDRGKIYILFGAPTNVSREMLPDASPREVWTYDNRVGKKFVFLDDSKIGEYRLVEYYDL